MAQRNVRTTLLESQAHLDLGERCTFRDQDRVLAYLAAHPHLVDILREADSEIARRFGEHTKVTLAVEDDVDQIGVETLWGSIRTKLRSREALDVLHRFDVEWWIARSKDVNEQLGLGFE